MPVQIPTLNRIAPQAPAPSGQIPTNVPNQAAATGAVMEGVSSVVNQYADYQTKLEERAVDLQATKLANDWEVKKRERLSAIGKMEGDTREHYAQLDKDSAQWADDVIGSVPDASDRLKQVAREKMATRDYALRDRQATQQGAQYEKYRQRVHDSTAVLIGQGMIDASGTVDAKKPDSFLNLQMQVDAAKKNRITEGIDSGTVIQNPDGSYNVSPIAKATILKDVSSHLATVVKSLNATGKTEEAKMVMDKFGDDISGDDKAKLLSDNKESQVKKEALGAVDNVLRKIPKGNPGAQMQALDKIPNLEVREKAKDFLNSHFNRENKVKEMQEKQVQEDASKYIRGAMAGNKWADLNEFREDPKIKTYVSKLTSQKDIDALEQQFQAPKYSDPKAEARIWNKIQDGSFNQYTPETLQRDLVGTNDAFRNRMMNRLSTEQTATGAEKNRMLNQMHKKMYEVMQRDADALGVDTYGDKIDPADVAKFNAMLDDDISKIPEGSVNLTDPVKARLYVENFMSNLKKDAVFDPKKALGLQGKYKFDSAAKPRATQSGTTGNADAPRTAPPKQAALPSLDSVGRKSWSKKFFDVKGRGFDPSKGDDMEAFRRQYGDKL